MNGYRQDFRTMRWVLLFGSVLSFGAAAQSDQGASPASSPASAASSTVETIPVAVLPESAQTDKQETAPQQLDAVVVTAQKREQNAQDVPMAVTAFNQKSLDNLNPTNQISLQQSVSGLARCNRPTAGMCCASRRITRRQRRNSMPYAVR